VRCSAPVTFAVSGSAAAVRRPPAVRRFALAVFFAPRAAPLEGALFVTVFFAAARFLFVIVASSLSTEH